MPIAFCGRDGPLSRSFVELTSQFLSVIGGEATINCCGDSTAGFNRALEKSPDRKARIQYPFSLTRLQFDQLLHNPSYCVMGKIDMLSMLRTLRLRLRRLLDERWIQLTQFFKRVNMSCKIPNFFVDLDVKHCVMC